MSAWDARFYPPRLEAIEATRLAQRREALRAQLTDAQMGELEQRHRGRKYIGLALSGGGLRSATFSLGFLQSLARQKQLRQVDYLSTVSGGSYIGGFLGALFHRTARARPTTQENPADANATVADANATVADANATVADANATVVDANATVADATTAAWNVEDELDPAHRSRVIEWLRDNGRYLAPGGASDGWAALAVILRNLVAVHVVLWTMVLTAFLLLDIARGWIVPGLDCPLIQPLLDRASGAGTVWWSPSLFLPALVVPMFLFPLGLAYWLVPESRTERAGGFSRRFLAWFLAWFLRWIALITNVTLLGFGAVMWLAGDKLGLTGAGTKLGGALAMGETVLSTLALLIALNLQEPRYHLTRWLKTWLVVFCLLLVAGFVDSLGQTVYRGLIQQDVRKVLITSVVAGVTALMTIGGGVQKVLGMVGFKKGGAGLPIQLIALVVALIVLLPVMVGWSAVGHGIVWNWQPPVPAPGAVTEAAPAAAAAPVPGAAMTFELEASGKMRFKPPAPDLDRPPLRDPDVDWSSAIVALLLGVGLCAFFGHTYSFLNNSSMASLYAARLTRAYLGASNKRRIDGDEVQKASTETLPSDRVDMGTYSPETHGGPLHIINATLNETIGGQSQVEERDRKGMNLALGPAGISVAARHHAVWEADADAQLKMPRALLKSVDVDGDAKPATGTTAPTAAAPTAVAKSPFRVFPVHAPDDDATADPLTFAPELLDLGRWIAISGAAASTALGSMTSLGLSLLCGLLNVRLGHWWWSDVDPRLRAGQTRPGILRWLAMRFSRCFPVQAHLVDELLARFPGTQSRNWYLTDGGHFENTGVYELIRRRVAVIVVVDNGADPATTLGDVANLVRKARVDFGVDITFDVPANPMDPAVGTLADLGMSPTSADGKPGVVKAYASIGIIHYPGRDPGKLLLVKPGVMGDQEPLDVLNYRATNRDFPQQTTADQFFDEAQWEAYRKLGNHIGDVLFGGSAPETRFAQLLT